MPNLALESSEVSCQCRAKPGRVENSAAAEDVFDFVEEALVFGWRVVVRAESLGELAHEFLLLFAQVRRRAHADVDLQVAAAVLAQVRDAFAADADDAAALRARGDFEGEL